MLCCGVDEVSVGRKGCEADEVRCKVESSAQMSCGRLASVRSVSERVWACVRAGRGGARRQVK